ncbi:hypothetical protein [Pleurocapsa sp. FMAR1]|uniref:hypothetical protein n=1 Tax=Pleurocapsa sp. FMAR1 TaxID=3040204 RepID=UPI0029C8B67C|nr:hypothetical protein [Pleurocapsa sp. FMAR1]
MRSHKIQKIDSSSEYPCPCRRKGNLKPIVLTEALGCDRCQQIFEIKKDGQVIEQLASMYQKKSWRWTGHRWKSAYDIWTQNYLTKILILSISTFVAVVVLPIMLRWLSTQSIISWAVSFLILIILLLMALFVVYRH